MSSFSRTILLIVLVFILIAVYMYKDFLISYISAIYYGIPLSQLTITNNESPNTNSNTGAFTICGREVKDLNPLDSVTDCEKAYYRQHPINNKWYPRMALIQHFYPANGTKRKWYADYVYDYINSFPEKNIQLPGTSPSEYWDKYSKSIPVDINIKEYVVTGKDASGKPILSIYEGSKKIAFFPHTYYANSYLASIVYGSRGKGWTTELDPDDEHFTPYPIYKPFKNRNCEFGDKGNAVITPGLGTYRVSPRLEYYKKVKMPQIDNMNLYAFCHSKSFGGSDLEDKLNDTSISGDVLFELWQTDNLVTLSGYANQNIFAANVIVKANQNWSGGKLDDWFRH